MRIVAIEEHVGRFDMVSRLSLPAVAERGWPRPDQMPPEYGEFARRLGEAPADRIQAMDQSAIAVQVLSVAGAGAEMLSADEGPAFAAEYNDHVAAMVRAHPDRFAGFAHLPMTAPEAAADELERSVRDLGLCGAMVNGTTDGLFLDDPRFDVLLARAAQLGCPLYLHPAPPPRAVREAYYDSLPGFMGALLMTGGWGWHYETALHVVRLAVSGALDRHRGLKLIVGHMGEGLPIMLGRLDDVLGGAAGHLDRPISTTILDHTWISTSGFQTLPPFLAALTSFGVDRMMFGVDYPFSPAASQVAFLESLPISPADRRKIAHENADALLGLR